MRAYRWILAVIVAVTANGCPDRSRSPGSVEGKKNEVRPVAQKSVAKAPPKNPPASLPLRRENTRAWSFDSDNTGDIASGFASEIGKWQVVADDAAPSKGRTLQQQAKSSDSTYNVALASGTNIRDLDLSVAMKSVTGRVDQGGGLVWRAADAKNYYIARFNPLEDNFRVYTVKDGRRRMLSSVRLSVPPRQWNTLRITMAGDHIKCYLDGKVHLDVHDSTFTKAGWIGLWTKADAQTRFDDLKVSPYKEP